MGAILVRSYLCLCASPSEGRQKCRHIRGFRKKFEKQLLFGRSVKTLKRVGCRGLLLPGSLGCWCGFRCTTAPIKLFLEPCGIYTAVIVQNVGISFRDHCGLCVAGVALDSLDVAAAEFELIGRAGVPETVKDHLGKIVVLNELAKGPIDKVCFGGRPLGAGEYKVIIPVFISQQFFQLVNRFLALYQHFSHRLGQKYLPHTRLGFRLFQGQHGGVAPPYCGELEHDTLFPHLGQRFPGNALKLLVDVDIGAVMVYAVLANIHTTPCQAQQFPHTQGTGKGQIDCQGEEWVITEG